MKQIEEKDIWLTASELASLRLKTLPHSRAAILRWANNQSWGRKNRKGSGAGSVYAFPSLPLEAKQEIKENVEKWHRVCEISKDRGFYKIKTGQNETNLETKLILSEADIIEATECGHRLIVEEFRLGFKRDGEDGLAHKLGISVEELAKYEHGEMPLNALHLRKLNNLGFDILFILLGERKEN